MSARPAADHRIVVAFDASAGSRAALTAAAAVARAVEADLEALFVEDLDLLHLAGLPFARALGAGGFQALDASVMERALRAQAAAAERATAELARGFDVTCRFRVTRDRIGPALLAATAAGDFIALGTTGGRARGPGLGSTARALLGAGTRSLLLATPETEHGGTVACLFDDSPPAREALARAATLARFSRQPLVVHLTAAEAGEAERQRASATAGLADSGVAARFRRTLLTEPRDLAAAILADAPATVVLARPAAMTQAAFQNLVARLNGVAWVTAAPEATE